MQRFPLNYSMKIERPLRKRAMYRAWRNKRLMAVCSPRNYEMVVSLNKYLVVHMEAQCDDDTYYVMWPISD